MVEYRGIRRVRGFLTHTLQSLPRKLERQLPDVAANAAQACVQSGVAQQVAALLFFVLLPCASERFVYTEPPATPRLVSGRLASEAEHAQSSAFKSRRLYARFFLPA